MLTNAIEVERVSYVGGQEKNVRSLVRSWDVFRSLPNDVIKMDFKFPILKLVQEPRYQQSLYYTMQPCQFPSTMYVKQEPDVFPACGN